MLDNPSIDADEQLIIDKYNKYKAIDPFLNDIPPALLNSADIHSYVKATGMIHPFEEKALKSASYAAKIAGECRYWDEKNQKFKTVLLEKDGDKLVLKPNSIAFVGIDPTFRLPDYIALRFNLKISNVYRGLLLGTGPLIDPGFEGKISIPLHNLTSNEYVFSYAESLIWIEFTKTSPLPNGRELTSNQKKEIEEAKELKCTEYISFPDDKKNKELPYYLNKALKGTRFNEIVSSIPSAMLEASKSAKEANLSAQKAKEKVQTIRNWSIAAAVGIILGIAGIVYNSWSLQIDYYGQSVSKIDQLDTKLDDNIVEINKKLMIIIEGNNKRISALESKIEILTLKGETSTNDPHRIKGKKQPLHEEQN